MAGIKAFAEKGYKNATISEIARQADVADGTVYEYFKNKEDLLLSIPEERFQHHLGRIKEAFSFRDPVRKLRRFIRYHFNLFLIDRDFLRVYLILILLSRRFYESRAYQSLRRYIQVLEDLVQGGIDDRSFASDANVRIFRNMFLGTFTHMVLRWFFLGKEVAVDKMQEINELTDLFTDALYVKPPDKAP
ncbi:MAG: TetR family transcriptional regulator [candidate division Zixibacteria bacterium]|nr:TetR family transcriptional regulator [candidate division Zixibacteria bacterium]